MVENSLHRPDMLSERTVGVLALQGGFLAHIQALSFCGINAVEIRTLADLSNAHSLIIPGGESSTLLKLLNSDLRDHIKLRAAAGMPILATCAGAILIARTVENPSQESLALIDITVRRNAYGRQSDSFIEPDLIYCEPQVQEGDLSRHQLDRFSREGVFIRAPRITEVGKKVRTILTRNNEPVMVGKKNIFAACFHPELSEQPHIAYQAFFAHIK